VLAGEETREAWRKEEDHAENNEYGNDAPDDLGDLLRALVK